ncbi:hypothetical protein EIW28_01240 [Glycomyces terrestris]|uniref:SHOCT domain-containing protein n=2 Tax=Glycomyces terrestris TaxID=2493553 RepID=A0A426V5U3_9ACTN|nr:hypothetical protein EIW28_01240 [Glycomyces terrestris]
MSGGDWWWAGFMMIFWLAVLVLLIWAVVRLGRAIGTDRGAADPATAQASAGEMLDRRYASGEIDTATYTEMRARLEGREPDGS